MVERQNPNWCVQFVCALPHAWPWWQCACLGACVCEFVWSLAGSHNNQGFWGMAAAPLVFHTMLQPGVHFHMYTNKLLSVFYRLCGAQLLNCYLLMSVVVFQMKWRWAEWWERLRCLPLMSLQLKLLKQMIFKLNLCPIGSMWTFLVASPPVFCCSLTLEVCRFWISTYHCICNIRWASLNLLEEWHLIERWGHVRTSVCLRVASMSAHWLCDYKWMNA